MTDEDAVVSPTDENDREDEDGNSERVHTRDIPEPDVVDLGCCNDELGGEA